jgi:myo-inositol-1(or 4)-monophosphatase
MAFDLDHNGGLPRLLARVCDVVRQAGAVALDIYSRAEVKNWEKGKDNPLTEADLAVDRLLHRELLGACPDFGWLSEETLDDAGRLGRDWVWVVDPIDGTKEFLQKVPHWTISIGLVHKGRPMLGVVFNPVEDLLVAGAKDHGVTVNGRPATMSAKADLQGAHLVGSRSEQKRGEFDSVKDLYRFEAVGSIAYKMALLAIGRCDIYYTLNPKHEWDICAGHFLVEEAGGRVCQKDGGAILYNRPQAKYRSVVAANPVLHPLLLERLRDAPLSPDRHAH